MYRNADDMKTLDIITGSEFLLSYGPATHHFVPTVIIATDEEKNHDSALTCRQNIHYSQYYDE